MELCEKVSDDLQRKGYRGKTIGMKLRYADFQTVTRDTTLDLPIDDAESIRGAVRSCLKRVPLNARLRLLGVRVGELVLADQPNYASSQSTGENNFFGQSLPLF